MYSFLMKFAFHYMTKNTIGLVRVDKETFSDHFIPLRGNFYFTKCRIAVQI